ncbi:MAG TPA: N-acetylmuramoyl-L-alanine amidase [Drouetiella sp.]|jgi:N-acetylmuramoyl-L-alanine amidase
MKSTNKSAITLISKGIALILLSVTNAFQVQAEDKTIIVLDPGHSGKDVKSVDAKTGLNDHDYPNHPEMEETFRVAKKVGEQLEKSGYSVLCTKKDVNDTVSLRERATIAQRAHAALGVSIHNDHGQSYKDFAQVYEQKVGQWRGGSTEKPLASFTNKEIAKISDSYAKIFARERSRAEQHIVTVTPISFDNRPGIEPGNIPQVMLFAGTEPDAVPWVYNEVGGKNFGPKQEALYATGIANAIKKCVKNSHNNRKIETTSNHKTVQ